LGSFQDRVLWTISLGWLWTATLLISASCVARIIGEPPMPSWKIILLATDQQGPCVLSLVCHPVGRAVSQDRMTWFPAEDRQARFQKLLCAPGTWFYKMSTRMLIPQGIYEK
jgi:hypothetical protein